MSGADNEGTAELRAASIKGALRFWFRAISYAKYKHHGEVKKVEDRLFGSVASQSSFFLKLCSKNVKVESESKKCKELFDIELAYLGYGLFKRKKGGNSYRPYLIPEGTFTLTILISPKNIKRINVKDLIEPIKALGLFGGLGSRSRRGFGSVTLTSITIDGKDEWTAPTTREELQKTIKEFYSQLQLNDEMPEYTSFCNMTKTVILDVHDNYKDALRNISANMTEFRKGYDTDTDILHNYLNTNKVVEHPKRVVFGLPHNYFLRGRGSIGVNAVINNIPARRSSPLFIKVISTKEEDKTRFIPVMTVFPSVFLPEGSKISLGADEKGLEPKIDFEIIDKFIKTFPNRLEVTPLD